MKDFLDGMRGEAYRMVSIEIEKKLLAIKGLERIRLMGRMVTFNKGSGRYMMEWSIDFANQKNPLTITVREDLKDNNYPKMIAILKSVEELTTYIDEVEGLEGFMSPKYKHSVATKEINALIANEWTISKKIHLSLANQIEYVVGTIKGVSQIEEGLTSYTFCKYDNECRASWKIESWEEYPLTITLYQDGDLIDTFSTIEDFKEFIDDSQDDNWFLSSTELIF